MYYVPIEKHIHRTCGFVYEISSIQLIAILHHVKKASD